MVKRQSGQALIMALILLAIGSVITVPSLVLTGNAVRNSTIVTTRAKDFYAADAAQEFTIWKLLYTNYISQFTFDGETDNFSVDVCGTPVSVSVVMRALASFHGVTLAQDTPIKPSKTVTPTNNPGGADLTYTIKMEQIGDNTSRGLDAVYDILPSDLIWTDYISGSSKLRVDGGAWATIDDPGYATFGGVTRLRWPATGNFTDPIANFSGGQIKEIQFKMRSTGLKNNRTFYNWVVLMPWKAISGAVAPVLTGTGVQPVGGLIDVRATALPGFVPPGVPTNVEYTISFTSQQGAMDQLQVITDYLPPGFSYVPGSTSGMSSLDPVMTYGPINGVDRWKLEWTKNQFPGGNDINIASGQTLVLRFSGLTSENVSGSYYNELFVQTKNPVPNAFSSLNISYADFNSGYTWNSAAVVVPAYDTSSSAGNVTVNSNLAVTRGGVAISSFQVK